jgi:hypothetical protein
MSLVCEGYPFAIASLFGVSAGPALQVSRSGGGRARHGSMKKPVGNPVGQAVIAVGEAAMDAAAYRAQPSTEPHLLEGRRTQDFC